MSRPAPRGTQAVVRALSLLKVFTEERPELSLHELCREVGLTKTTTHRLLAALESEGLVERVADRGSFRLGPGAVALGQRALHTSDLRSTARPTLLDLAQESGETVTLEVPVDVSMLILDAVVGGHLVAANAEIGTRWPMHDTSTGKAYMAALEEPQGERLLAASLAAAKATAESGRYREELRRCRRRGWAEAVEAVAVGFVAVGAAFSGPDGQISGALSIGGPKSRLGRPRRGELGRLVMEAAQRLSDRGG